jgi:outer membrane protein assembly factor BamB
MGKTVSFRALAPFFVYVLSYAGGLHAQHANQEQHFLGPLSESNNLNSGDRAINILQIPDQQPEASDKGNWLGWGGGVYNNRWAASDAIVDSTNGNSLKLHCQKKYDPGTSASPLVVDGVAYFPTWSGLLVALDYENCKEIWRRNISEIIHKFKPLSPLQVQFAAAVSRTTPVLKGDTLYIGTLAHALVLAIKKKDGTLVDSLQISTHPFAILTQSPLFYDNKLFIGCSSIESGVTAFIDDYVFTFSGSMNAVSLKHGRLTLLWTTSTIPPELRRRNLTGAAIWGSQPSVDPVRRQVFVGSGNLYDVPEELEACQNKTQGLAVVQDSLTADPCIPRHVNFDSILAFDIDTGRINWAHVFSPLDAWNAACVDGLLGPPVPGVKDACPEHPGPDADFGMAPAFVLGSANTPEGIDVVVVGQKSGNLYALSAQAGVTMWAVMPGPGGLEGGLTWGIAVDSESVYYVAANSLRINYTLPLSGGKIISNSAYGAASLKTGEILWQVPAPGNMTSFVAPAVANDVVLVGTTGSYDPTSLFPLGPGKLNVLDKTTGRILTDQWLDATFHGAPAAVHEYVFLGTGYGGVHPLEAGSFQVWKLKQRAAGQGKARGNGEL